MAPLDGDEPFAMSSVRPVASTGAAPGAPPVSARTSVDFMMTYLSEALMLVAGLVTFHLVARRFGTQGFSDYQVARGIIALVAPVAGLGLATSFLKHLPTVSDAPRVLTRMVVLHTTALGVVCGVMSMSAAVLGTGFGLFSLQLAIATAVVGAAITMFTLVLSGLRGVAMPVTSSVMGSVGLGLGPLVAIAVSASLVAMFWVQAGVLVLLATLALLRWQRQPTSASSVSTASRPGLRAAQRIVVRYGLSRVLGDIALPLVFVLPTLYVAYADEGSAAGYIGFATSVVMLGCSALATLTPILLPRFSRVLSTGGAISRQWTTIGPFGVALAALVCTAVGELSSGWVVGWYLGDAFAPAATVTRVCLLAAVPLALFYYSRVVLDAMLPYAWSARTAFVGFCVGSVTGAVLSVWASPLVVAESAFLASAVSMGLAALASLVRLRGM